MAAAAPNSRIAVEEYRVLFDGQKQGQRANAGGAVFSGGRLDMVFTGAIEDDEAGTLPYIVPTPNLGKSWTPARRFGTELLERLLKTPESEFVALALSGPTRAHTVLAVGYHVARGVHKRNLSRGHTVAS
jgi:hypothetical protein